MGIYILRCSFLYNICSMYSYYLAILCNQDKIIENNGKVPSSPKNRMTGYLSLEHELRNKGKCKGNDID